MADYYTQFSCIFDVGTAENVRRAAEIRQELAETLEDDEGADLGFDVEPDPRSGSGALWISSDDYGEPEHVSPSCSDVRRRSTSGDAGASVGR